MSNETPILFFQGRLITVIWSDALIMMPAAVAGGCAGARIARRLPERHLRYGIVAVGAITTVAFFFEW